jgi:hypothetical protein
MVYLSFKDEKLYGLCFQYCVSSEIRRYKLSFFGSYEVDTYTTMFFYPGHGRCYKSNYVAITDIFYGTGDSDIDYYYSY